MSLLVDAGPLVAYLSVRDAHHVWARRWLKQAAAPLLTCEPVLTEACFLLRRDGRDPALVLDLVQAGGVALAFPLNAQAERLAALIRRYADRPMSLADACLVLLSEAHPRRRLLTTDVSDFTVYRRADGSSVPAAFPTDLPP